MGRRARVALILLAAAVGGAGTMTVELAAVRLLAPWFGSSLVVWTNVIAVVLLALALGYLGGARLSRRGTPLLRMGWGLCLAAALTGLLPVLAPLAEALFLPRGLALEEAAGVVLWGSLAASLLLFLPPAALLGTVAPLAVEAVAEGLEDGRAGQAGGLVLCTSTLGSLAGVFGTSHLLLPTLGLGGTYLVAAGALAGAGGLSLGLARRPAGLPAGLVALLGLLGAALAGPAPPPELGEGQRLLATAESPYQSIRIVEQGAGPTVLRLLQVNEGFDSYQSVWQPEEGLLPLGYYYNDFALPAWWTWAEGTLPATWRVVVLGLGGGTAFRVLRGASPPGLRLSLLGVELDPEVVRLARAHLDLDPPRGSAAVLAGLDARVAVRSLAAPAHLVLLDCYANQVEIPAHLCTVEFFGEIRAALAEGGWLAVNIGGFGFDDPVVEAVSASCARGFAASVLLLHVPFARNYTLIARRDGPLPVLSGGVEEGFPAALAALLAPRALAEGWRRVEPPAADDARLLRDGHCPIEKLQQRSIREGHRRLLATLGR